MSVLRIETPAREDEVWLEAEFAARDFPAFARAMNALFKEAEALWPEDYAREYGEGEDEGAGEEAAEEPLNRRRPHGGMRPIRVIRPGSKAEAVLAAARDRGTTDAQIIAREIGVTTRGVAAILGMLRPGGHLDGIGEQGIGEEAA